MQLRIFISCTLFFLFSTVLSFAQNNFEYTSLFSHLVYEWNQYHNTKNINGFESLYASTVLFYGKYEDEAKCLRTKSYFLNKMKVYEQNIISPVITSMYTSGTVKCSFTKQVIYKQRSKEYPSYLLFEKRGNEWKITGESDLETDQNMHVQLKLGNDLPITKATSSNNLTATILILITIAGAAWVFYFTRSKKKKAIKLTEIPNTDNLADKIPFTKHPVAKVVTTNATIDEKPNTSVPGNKNRINKSAIADKLIIDIPYSFKEQSDAIQSVTLTISTQATPVQPSIEDENKRKGDAFEKAMVSKFPKEYYTLIDWRSDKIHDGRYAMNNMHPDIEFDYKKTNIKFAIECKYRSDFYHGTIEWAKAYQLRNYKKYAEEKKITVFVVIGVGGEPSNPGKLYVIPLQNIKTTALTREELHPYERLRNGDFHFDVTTMQIK